GGGGIGPPPPLIREIVRDPDLTQQDRMHREHE
ncbi:MAG: hypothetical protein K0S43_2920, partial [Cellulosimicrobium sp.]|nr:hypothetical protein [Cellulosimicrobium sp.]